MNTISNKEVPIMFIEYFKHGENVNLCAPRAYYVPFEKGQARSDDRATSRRFLSLNGVLKIKAYDTVYDAENFLSEPCENDIPVPSCVQYYGYDYFQYTNTNYPFPFAYQHTFCCYNIPDCHVPLPIWTTLP